MTSETVAVIGAGVAGLTAAYLLRLFGELGVTTQDSEMSMSVRCLGCGLEYAGARRLTGLFPGAGNAVRGRYLRLLGEIPRFHRDARRLLRADVADGRRRVREYVERAAKGLTAVHVSTPVRSVLRHPGGVEVRDAAGETHTVDRVVLATHADQALALLADATPEEKRVLGAFSYSRNETWLHTDSSLLPVAPGARASWNYL